MAMLWGLPAAGQGGIRFWGFAGYGIRLFSFEVFHVLPLSSNFFSNSVRIACMVSVLSENISTVTGLLGVSTVLPFGSVWAESVSENGTTGICLLG